MAGISPAPPQPFATDCQPRPWRLQVPNRGLWPRNSSREMQRCYCAAVARKAAIFDQRRDDAHASADPGGDGIGSWRFVTLAAAAVGAEKTPPAMQPGRHA